MFSDDLDALLKERGHSFPVTCPRLAHLSDSDNGGAAATIATDPRVSSGGRNEMMFLKALEPAKPLPEDVCHCSSLLLFKCDLQSVFNLLVPLLFTVLW